MPAQRAARARRFCSFFLRAARLRAVLRRLGVRSWARIVASYEGCRVNGRGVSGVHLRCGLGGVRHGLLGSREAIDPPRRPSGLRTGYPDPWSRFQPRHSRIRSVSRPLSQVPCRYRPFLKPASSVVHAFRLCGPAVEPVRRVSQLIS
jgi:hypothetical protein